MTDNQEVFETLTLRLREAKDRLEQATKVFDETKQSLTKLMEVYKRKTVRATDGVLLIQATYKQNSQVIIDEEGLRKRMGAPVFDGFTFKKLDRKKLEQALDDDEALRLAVAPFVTTKKSAPFIQLTVKEQKDGE